MIPWLDIARRYLGTKEIPGAKSNPVILQWITRFRGWVRSFYTSDDIPWCALFVGACLSEAGVSHTNSLAARSYETYGIALTQPSLGCIMVFTRNGGGHVGFYLGERTDAYRILGGNQSDAVTETWVSKARHTATRWPAEWGLPVTGRILLANNGQPVSTNEA